MEFSRRAKVWAASAVAGTALVPLAALWAMAGGGPSGRPSPTRVVTGTPDLAAGSAAGTSGPPAAVVFSTKPGKRWIVRRHGGATTGTAPAGPTVAAAPSPTTAGGPGPATTPAPSSPTTTGGTTTGAPPTTTAPPPTTTAPPPSPTTSAAPSSSTLNSIARIEYSMDGPHEGLLHGVPPSWSWGSHPTVALPSNGQDAAVTAWGQIYADANATEPGSGVRVEIKNMETYVWSLSQRKWLRAQATVQVSGDHYVEDFANNASITADWRAEPDGGTSSAMVAGYNLHFWPSAGRGSVAPYDIGAVYTTYQARLIGPNAAAAKYLANVGGDWWLDTTIGYGNGGNNPGIGQGRFVYLSTNWSAVDFYTGGLYGTGVPGAWTDAQMAASGPPIDAMGLP